MPVSAVAGPTAPPYGDPDGGWPSPSAAYRPRLWHALVAIALLALVLLDVVLDGALRQFDAVTAAWFWDVGIRQHDVLGTIGYLLSQAGGRGTNLAWIVVLCAVVFVQRRTLAPLVQVLSAAGLMYVAVYPIKELLARSYPADPGGDYLHAVGSLGGAFPSGHQANATLLASVGAWIAMQYIRNRRIRRIVAVYALLAPAVSAVAVLVMGYHWVSDIIAGTCAGVILLYVVRWFWATSAGQRLIEILTLPPVAGSDPT